MPTNGLASAVPLTNSVVCFPQCHRGYPLPDLPPCRSWKRTSCKAPWRPSLCYRPQSYCQDRNGIWQPRAMSVLPLPGNTSYFRGWRALDPAISFVETGDSRAPPNAFSRQDSPSCFRVFLPCIMGRGLDLDLRGLPVISPTVCLKFSRVD